MSLTTTHRLWTTAGPKPYEVAKARIQLLFLTSQYRCGELTKHWSLSNPEGLCSFPFCSVNRLVESPEHILLQCPAYSTTRHDMISLCLNTRNPISHCLAIKYVLSNSTQKTMQFLLDCTALPEVILSAQQHGEQVYTDLFYMSRTWCFALHRERMKRICKWNFH